MNYEELEERPYIDSFHYIEYIGEKLQDKKLKTINRFLKEDRIKQHKEIERLNSIIKEVREILESKKHCERLFGGVDGETFIEQALEILNKGSDKE